MTKKKEKKRKHFIKSELLARVLLENGAIYIPKPKNYTIEYRIYGVLPFAKTEIILRPNELL